MNLILVKQDLDGPQWTFWLWTIGCLLLLQPLSLSLSRVGFWISAYYYFELNIYKKIDFQRLKITQIVCKGWKFMETKFILNMLKYMFFILIFGCHTTIIEDSLQYNCQLNYFHQFRRRWKMKCEIWN